MRLLTADGRWRARLIKRGLCTRGCGRAAVRGRRMCLFHLVAERERNRQRYGYSEWRPGSRGGRPYDAEDN